MKEYRVLLRAIAKQGFVIERRRSNHYKIISPTGTFIFCSSTPSDRRALLNLIADLKRIGYKNEA